MIRPLLAVVSLAIATTVVVAQQNPIEARQALMKANSAQAKIGAAMAKGEAPFDLAKAQKIFTTYE
jgi:cytochrome c556